MWPILSKLYDIACKVQGWPLKGCTVFFDESISISDAFRTGMDRCKPLMCLVLLRPPNSYWIWVPNGAGVAICFVFPERAPT